MRIGRLGLIPGHVAGLEGRLGSFGMFQSVGLEQLLVRYLQ
jgi:hypothetical protein